MRMVDGGTSVRVPGTRPVPRSKCDMRTTRTWGQWKVARQDASTAVQEYMELRFTVDTACIPY